MDLNVPGNGPYTTPIVLTIILILVRCIFHTLIRSILYKQTRSRYISVNDVFYSQNYTFSNITIIFNFYGVTVIQQTTLYLCIIVIILVLIHLLTAIGLPPAGSSTVHIYTQTVQQ
jgi:hypothetical protein